MTISAPPQADAVVVIRMLPPAEVSPNSHVNWRKKGKAAAEFREAAAKATKHEATGTETFQGCLDPVTIDVEIAWCCGRKRLDDDNAKAALKGAIDGIADVPWGGQDRHVTIGTVRQVRGEGVVWVMIRGEG